MQQTEERMSPLLSLPDCPCGACGLQMTGARAWQLLFDTDDAQAVAEARAGGLNLKTCEHCGYSATLDVPFLFVDTSAQRAIFVRGEQARLDLIGEARRRLLRMAVERLTPAQVSSIGEALQEVWRHEEIPDALAHEREVAVRECYCLWQLQMREGLPAAHRLNRLVECVRASGQAVIGRGEATPEFIEIVSQALRDAEREERAEDVNILRMMVEYLEQFAAAQGTEPSERVSEPVTEPVAGLIPIDGIHKAEGMIELCLTLLKSQTASLIPAHVRAAYSGKAPGPAIDAIASLIPAALINEEIDRILATAGTDAAGGSARDAPVYADLTKLETLRVGESDPVAPDDPMHLDLSCPVEELVRAYDALNKDTPVEHVIRTLDGLIDANLAAGDVWAALAMCTWRLVHVPVLGELHQDLARLLVLLKAGLCSSLIGEDVNAAKYCSDTLEPLRRYLDEAELNDRPVPPVARDWFVIGLQILALSQIRQGRFEHAMSNCRWLTQLDRTLSSASLQVNSRMLFAMAAEHTEEEPHAYGIFREAATVAKDLPGTLIWCLYHASRALGRRAPPISLMQISWKDKKSPLADHEWLQRARRRQPETAAAAPPEEIEAAGRTPTIRVIESDDWQPGLEERCIFRSRGGESDERLLVTGEVVTGDPSVTLATLGVAVAEHAGDASLKAQALVGLARAVSLYRCTLARLAYLVEARRVLPPGHPQLQREIAYEEGLAWALHGDEAWAEGTPDRAREAWERALHCFNVAAHCRIHTVRMAARPLVLLSAASFNTNVDRFELDAHIARLLERLGRFAEAVPLYIDLSRHSEHLRHARMGEQARLSHQHRLGRTQSRVVRCLLNADGGTASVAHLPVIAYAVEAAKSRLLLDAVAKAGQHLESKQESGLSAGVPLNLPSIQTHSAPQTLLLNYAALFDAPNCPGGWCRVSARGGAGHAAEAVCMPWPSILAHVELFRYSRTVISAEIRAWSARGDITERLVDALRLHEHMNGVLERLADMLLPTALLDQCLREDLSEVCFSPHLYLYHVPFSCLRPQVKGARRYLCEITEAMRIIESPNLTLSVCTPGTEVDVVPVFAMASSIDPVNNLGPAAAEIRALLAECADERPVSCAFGKRATREQFLESLISASVVVYLGHGLEQKGGRDIVLQVSDGTVSYQDIVGLRRLHEGVVCETCLLFSCSGGQVNFEENSAASEPTGLCLALRQIGVATVVGCKWPVHEKAVELFCTFFVRHYQKSGDGAAACHAAVRQMARQPLPWGHPYFLGCVHRVLIGQSSAVLSFTLEIEGSRCRPSIHSSQCHGHL